MIAVSVKKETENKVRLCACQPTTTTTIQTNKSEGRRSRWQRPKQYTKRKRKQKASTNKNGIERRNKIEQKRRRRRRHRRLGHSSQSVFCCAWPSLSFVFRSPVLFRLCVSNKNEVSNEINESMKTKTAGTENVQKNVIEFLRQRNEFDAIECRNEWMTLDENEDQKSLTEWKCGLRFAAMPFHWISICVCYSSIE